MVDFQAGERARKKETYAPVPARTLAFGLPRSSFRSVKARHAYYTASSRCPRRFALNSTLTCPTFLLTPGPRRPSSSAREGQWRSRRHPDDARRVSGERGNRLSAVEFAPGEDASRALGTLKPPRVASGENPSRPRLKCLRRGQRHARGEPTEGSGPLACAPRGCRVNV